jgi:hypothetical protein
LCPATPEACVQRQQTATLTRKLALLRAHGLFVPVPKTHGDRLGAQGQRVSTALWAADEADVNRRANAA